MRPSVIRLEHYNLTSLSIEPVEGYAPNFDEGLYPKFSNADFDIRVRLGEPVDDDDEYMIRLFLKASPKADKPFPYTFSVGADAVLTYHGKKDNAERRELLLVNGASLLYSALREMLFSLTFRFSTGPMMLPSANFIDLKDELLSQAAKVQEDCLPTPVDVPLKKTRSKSAKK